MTNDHRPRRRNAPPRWSYIARIRALSLEAAHLDYDGDRMAAMRREREIHLFEVTRLRCWLHAQYGIDTFDVALPVAHPAALAGVLERLAEDVQTHIHPAADPAADLLRRRPAVPPPMRDPDLAGITSAPRPGPAAGIAPAA